jgi:Fic-DOC domain mobile mystery protein B
MLRARPGETRIDPSFLKKKGIINQGQLDRAEAENVRKATIKYLAKAPSKRTAPFDFSWALRLHRQMFGDVWKWAGRIRTEDLNLGIHWELVEPALYTLLGNLLAWEESGMHLLEQAVRLHHEGVRIHPFMGGNGRWSRMLANIWLKRHKQAITQWPAEVSVTVSPIRGAYIEAIKKADEGELDPLIELHRRYTG